MVKKEAGPNGWIAAESPGRTPQRRRVGPLLAAGILALPPIFVWVPLLNRAYSHRARSLSCLWLLVVCVAIATALNGPDKAASTSAGTAPQPEAQASVAPSEPANEDAPISAGESRSIAQFQADLREGLNVENENIACIKRVIESIPLSASRNEIKTRAISDCLPLEIRSSELMGSKVAPEKLEEQAVSDEMHDEFGPS